MCWRAMHTSRAAKEKRSAEVRTSRAGSCGQASGALNAAEPAVVFKPAQPCLSIFADPKSDSLGSRSPSISPSSSTFAGLTSRWMICDRRRRFCVVLLCVAQRSVREALCARAPSCTRFGARHYASTRAHSPSHVLHASPAHRASRATLCAPTRCEVTPVRSSTAQRKARAYSRPTRCPT